MIKRFLKDLSIYLLLICGGTVLFLTISPLVGYLAYSDRPGPGAFERTQPDTISEVWHYLQFAFSYAIFLGIYATVIGSIGILFIRGLEKLKLNKILVRIIGGIALFLATGYIALGIGWYIAAGGPLTYFTAFLGLLCGAVVIPKRRKAEQASAVNVR